MLPFIASLCPEEENYVQRQCMRGCVQATQSSRTSVVEICGRVVVVVVTGPTENLSGGRGELTRARCLRVFAPPEIRISLELPHISTSTPVSATRMRSPLLTP